MHACAISSRTGTCSLNFNPTNQLTS